MPLAVPQRLPLGGTIQLDPSSHWHTSALLASAVETVSLPSRLKDTANRDTLGTIADMLNAMGKQNVAGLQMSFSPQEIDSEGEARLPVAAYPEMGEDGDGREEVIRLDIDFSPSDQLDAYTSSLRNRSSHKKPKVFSQSLVWRGYAEKVEEEEEQDARMADNEEDDYDDEELQRRRRILRRRLSNETVTKRYVSSVIFSLPSPISICYSRPVEPRG